jgi:ABC-type dipeptide/oligopeptide/nickel transport system permease subunit
MPFAGYSHPLQDKFEVYMGLPIFILMVVLAFVITLIIVGIIVAIVLFAVIGSADK